MTKKDGNSQQRVDEIVVELLANELSVPKIAKEFGVTKSCLLYTSPSPRD